MRIGHHIFSVLLSCLGFFVYAQPEKVLTELTTSEGLSINSVNDMLFDKQGFLWIATADGLQRFDGYQFETFKHNRNKKNTLPHNYVTGLYEDANENLWISHYTAMVVKPKGKQEFIDISKQISPFVIHNPVTVVNENDSTIWILNNPGGIFSLSKTSFTAKKIFSLPQKFFEEGYYLFSAVKKRGDKIWFRKRGSKDGDVFTITDKGIQQFSNTNRLTILLMIPEGKDSLVIITDKQSFLSSVRDPLTPVYILQDHLDPDFVENQFITYPRPVAKNQSLLVGTKNAYIFDHVKRMIHPFPYSQYFPTDFPRYLYLSAKDQAGNSWFGFNGSGGVKMLPHLAQKFNQFGRPDDNAMPYCMASDYEGKIYVGIYTGGIEVYDKHGHFVQHIKLHLGNQPLNSPRSIALVDSSTLLIKATYNQLFTYDIHKQKLRDISKIIPYPNPEIFMADFEPYLQQIREDEVWLSARNNIYSITKNENSYHCKIVCSIPQDERVSTFYRSPDGKLWIGSIISGWSYIEGNLQRLPFKSYVKHINQDPAGNVWFASTDGIFVLKDNKVIKRLNQEDGLPNSFIYGILFDENANAWVSTNRGLARIDKNWTVTSYSGKEGLQGDEFNTHGYLKGADGTLYFAGINGINFFKPSDLSSKTSPVRTLLTGVEINNSQFTDSIEVSDLTELQLSYREENIRLSFAYMDFTSTEKNRFKFWLKGVQNDWTLPQTNHTVQYFLTPGEYQLYVLGSNYEGVWSKDPLVLTINILPPWYQTTLTKIIFLVIVLIAGAVSFYFLYRNRYRRKLGKLQMDREVHNEKQRLSRDLHDNLGSQITWLSNYINQLEKAEQEDQPVGEKLARLKEGAGELMQTLRETIWILNRDKVNCVELFDKVVSLAARHVEVCPPIQLHTEEKISTNMELNAGLALQMFRICQEAINNTCKHSNATLLKISAVTTDHSLTIAVGDNGSGFNYSNNGVDGHYGLQNMKDRAQENGLEFRISTSAQEGTTVFVSTHL